MIFVRYCRIVFFILAFVVLDIIIFLAPLLSGDINAIKPQEMLSESVSPTGEYKITAYLNNGGATTAYAVLCVLSHDNCEKNIYWNYRCDSADIEWVDEDTVIINGVRLENVEEDVFDYRKKD